MMSDLDRLHERLEHAREDYQHVRTFCSVTGVRYTPECIEAKRRAVAELEAAVEAAQNEKDQKKARHLAGLLAKENKS